MSPTTAVSSSCVGDEVIGCEVESIGIGITVVTIDD